MSTTISRSKAKQLTLLYQLLATGCVLGAIALGVFGLPESITPALINAARDIPATPDPLITSQANADDALPFRSRIDTGSIAARLAMLDNAPKIEEPVETDPQDTLQATQEPEPQIGIFAKRVRYTGYIQDDENPMAFIRIDGTQRIIPQGGIALAGSMGLDDLTIKLIRPNFILVTDGQINDKVRLMTQSGPSITMASGTQIVVADVAESTEDDLSPEELAELTPRQRAMRTRMLKRETHRLNTPGMKNTTPLATFRSDFNADPTSHEIRRLDGKSDRD